MSEKADQPTPTAALESTVAHIAGTIAAGLVNHPSAVNPFMDGFAGDSYAIVSVRLARAIMAEVERTRPAAELRTVAEAHR